MNLEFIRMVMLSVKRRCRSMWKVALISFLCVFLFVGIMVFQDCMNQFQREIAFLESGEWIVSTKGESRCLEEHAWVDGYGTTLVRTSLYNEPKDGNMDDAREEGPIGVVDDSFIQLSNLVFYAGKMPEQADEIALTQHVLSDMGCSYELDQMLSLAYIKGYDAMGKPVLGHIRYKLVGILENYTADWVLSEELPEFFVTMEGLEQIHVSEEDQQRCYYYLNQAQRDITGERFYQDMREVLKKQGEDHLVYSLVYNENAYDVTMWGSQTIYLVMMSLCGILGAMSLIYLFLMCCNNRRPYYFKLRELGAGTGQVREMVCIEWSSMFLPAACIAMLVAGAISVFVAAIISRHFGIPFVFRLTGRSIRMILFFTLGVFLLVMLWACMFFRIKDLHQMTGMISPRRLKHMYRKRDRGKNPLRIFQIRRKRTEPGKNIAQILFLIATMTIFLYSITMIQSASHAYQESKKLPDLYVRSIGEGSGANSSGFGWELETRQPDNCEMEFPEVERTVSIGNGLPADVIKDLKRISAVQSVCGAAADDQITLSWNGMQNSPFLNDYYTKMWVEANFKFAAAELLYMEAYSEEWDRQWHEIYSKLYAVMPDPQEHPDVYEESVVGIERTEGRNLLLKKFFGSRFRSEDFWSGKQSILFQIIPTGARIGSGGADDPADSPTRKPLQGVMVMNPQNQKCFYGKWGEKYHYQFEENTIHTGDKLQILHEKLPAGKTVETEIILCGDSEVYEELIMDPAISANWEYIPYESEYCGMQLLTSDTVLQQFASAADIPFTYKTLLIDVEEGVKRKQIEAEIADVLSRYECSFGSNLGKKQQEKSRFYRQFIMFGVILILTGSVYLFISRSMQNKSMELTGKQLQQFLQCGCNRAELLRSYSSLRVREILWACFSIPLCMVIMAMAQGLSYWKQCRAGAMEFQRKELLSLCMDTMKEYVNNPVGWIFFLGFLVLAVWFGIRGMKHYLNRLELMGHEE